MSFETAAKRLGCHTLIETQPTTSSSMCKGETLHDTLATVACYADCIVMRHPNEQEALTAVKGLRVPVINGGWGNWEHPTQTLVDMYTFSRTFGNLQNVAIAIVGDVNTRTSRSLVHLCDTLGVNYRVICHTLFQANGQQLHTENAERHVVDSEEMFKEAIQGVNVVYYSNYTGTGETEVNRQIMFRDMYLSLEYLRETELLTGKRVHVYSPLPRRVGEMDTRVDGTPFDLSFPAMKYSVELRMALLRRVFEGLSTMV
jgi:aspartate carbamoyltransferase catalytic subunit